MAVIITGGTGFIGSFLARELLSSSEEEIILFDYRISEKRILDISNNPRIKIIQGDVSSWSNVVSLFKDKSIKAVYHFGSLMPPYTENNLQMAFNINIKGSFNVFECARIFKVPKIIYSSSGAIYGPGVDLPVTEQTYRDPWTMYGVGKVCSEVIGTYYHRRKNVKFVAFRFPALIGPGRIGKGLTMWANNIIQYPAQGEKAICNVEPDVAVPILYIKDATKMLAEVLYRNSIDSYAYNIDGVWLKAEELESMVKKEISEAEIEYEPDPVLSFQLKSWEMMKGDDSLIREELGFNPVYKPEDFVKDFISEVATKDYFKI
ncbi:MAG: NAD-dependent epimerase/dehydratase family protein [Candidatus Hodarchaeales archaeon]